LIESGKSAVLIVLVLASLLLSARLWGGYDAEPVDTQPEPPGGVQVPNTLFYPQWAVFHDGSGDERRDANHREMRVGSPGFLDIMSHLQKILQGIHPADFEPAGGEEFYAHIRLQERQRRGITMLLAGSIPLDLWLLGLGEVRDHLPEIPRLPVDRILLYQGDSSGEGGAPAVHLCLGSSRGWLTAKYDGPLALAVDWELDEAAGGLELALSQAVNWEDLVLEPGIFVPQEPPMVPTLLGARSLGEEELLAPPFFPDPSVVRRIDERTGVTTYTDGQRQLRISPVGVVEYAVAGNGGTPVTDEWSALSQAVSFWRATGVGTDRGRLMEVIAAPNERGTSYTFRFGCSTGGSPLVAGRAPVSVTVGTAGIQAFSAIGVDTREAVAPRPAIPAYSALKSLAGLSDLPPWDKHVSRLYLAHLLDQSSQQEAVLRPVWMVETAAGGRYAVNAYSGEVCLSLWGDAPREAVEQRRGEN